MDSCRYIDQLVSIIWFPVTFGLDLWNITFYDIYNNNVNNLHFHQILHHSKPVVYQNLKLEKTFLPKGYLILVIPGIVSIDHVHYRNSQLYNTRLMLWILWMCKLGLFKVERWVLVFHIIISFVFWYDDSHHNTNLRAE